MAFGTSYSQARRRRERRPPLDEAISPHYAAPGSTPTATAPGSTRPVPSAPAAPPAVQAPSIQDATYNDVVNQAWQTLGNQTSYVAGQQGLLRSSYGYLDDNFTIDPSNPFGQAQLLKRSYDQSVKGTQGGYAARGQQTSGAYGRAQGTNTFNYQQGSNALQNAFLSQNAALIQQLRDAQSTYGGAVIGAGGDALQRAIAARGNPAASTGAAAAAGGLAAGEFIKTSPKDGKTYVYFKRPDGKVVQRRRA